MSHIEDPSRRSTAAGRSHRPGPPAVDGVAAAGLGRLARTSSVVAGLAAAIALIGFVAVTVAPARSAAAQQNGPPTESAVRLTSARFDLDGAGPGPVADDGSGPLTAVGADREARYRSLTISDGDRSIPVIPRSGPVGVTVSPGHAPAVAAEINGQRIGHASDEFTDAVVDAVSSSSAHRFARLDLADDGTPAALDLRYTPPLASTGYLLIQELSGDAAVDVTAINGSGDPVGSPVRVGPGYQWDTGHGSPTDGTSWASVIAIASLQVGPEPIHGLRVSAAGAQVKAIALVAEPPAEVVPDQPRSGQADGAADAAIGLQASIKPAVAVEGAGCTAEIGADVVAGQSATFCYLVSNLGATDLVDVRFDDDHLGLADTTLPAAGGSEPLRPGDQAIYYYHSVVDQRSAEAVTTVSARSVATSDGPPGPVATASGAPGAVLPVNQPADAQDGAGAPIEPETPPGSDAPLDVAAAAADSTAAPADSTAARADASPPVAGPVAAAEAVGVTQLALTGLVTEPWVMVVFAMAFIFFGYTIYAAFHPDPDGGEPCGHDQLDALGFD